jgi:hypothetical protein
MRTATLRNKPSKLVQALVAAVASAIGVMVLVAVMGAWSILADVYPIILAIAMIAGLIGAVLKVVPWYLAALLGSAVGFVSAFGVATYAISKI